MTGRRKWIRGLSWLLACALALCAYPAVSQAEGPAAAPLTAGATKNGMVRVRLSSLGAPASLTLTVSGSYTVNGQSEKTLVSGSQVTVKYNAAAGNLSLVSSGVTTSMGSSFRLRRHASDGQNGVKIAQGRVPGNLYPGDFQFTVQNGVYYIVAYIYMEDYLCGVLPYEMGASSPLEALKAQAIAARTYTMRAMSRGSSLYDVVDTTGDQVYNGTPASSSACTQAVNATKGIALQYGDSFAAAYYTASNGGQTESVKNAWGTVGYPYLDVKDDPYDLNNPDARKVSFFVSASGNQSNGTLASLLANKAVKTFGTGAQINAVSAVTPHTPKYPAPSKLYTKLDFSVTYQKGGVISAGVLTFDIFSELEGPLGMSINSGSNELWSVSPAVGGFTVTARRYGHGLGMSQRGAMQMGREGYSCAQILGFYFPGCTQVQFTLTRSILSPIVSGQPSQEQLFTEAPAPIETPLASPVPEAPSLYAVVTTAKGSLNLRESPRSTAKVLRTIPQYESIPILEKGDAWCRTAYGGYTGYVMTSFLTFGEGSAPIPAPTASPAPSEPAEALTARVTTAKGSLNLRESPSSSARILRTIPQYADVAVLDKGDAWCRVQYLQVTGYVMTGFLTFQGAAETPAPTASPAPTAAPAPVPAAGGDTARVTTPQGSLNLRKYARDTAQVLLTIPQNDIVLVREKGSAWCAVTYNGVSGYVMTKFLSFGASSPLPAATAAPTPAPVISAPQDGEVARVATPQGSLNLRQYARDSAKVLTTVPQNAFVTVYKRGSAWCHVAYNGFVGYVMTKFLSFSAAASAAGAPSSSGPALDPTLKELKDPVVGRVMPTDKRLNLRRECSTDSKVLYEIPKYEYLIITAVGDTWCQVEYENKQGFCMTKYLEFTLYE